MIQLPLEAHCPSVVVTKTTVTPNLMAILHQCPTQTQKIKFGREMMLIQTGNWAKHSMDTHRSMVKLQTLKGQQHWEVISESSRFLHPQTTPLLDWVGAVCWRQTTFLPRVGCFRSNTAGQTWELHPPSQQELPARASLRCWRVLKIIHLRDRARQLHQRCTGTQRCTATLRGLAGVHLRSAWWVVSGLQLKYIDPLNYSILFGVLKSIISTFSGSIRIPHFLGCVRTAKVRVAWCFLTLPLISCFEAIQEKLKLHQHAGEIWSWFTIKLWHMMRSGLVAEGAGFSSVQGEGVCYVVPKKRQDLWCHLDRSIITATHMV